MSLPICITVFQAPRIIIVYEHDYNNTCHPLQNMIFSSVSSWRPRTSRTASLRRTTNWNNSSGSLYHWLSCSRRSCTTTARKRHSMRCRRTTEYRTWSRSSVRHKTNRYDSACRWFVNRCLKHVSLGQWLSRGTRQGEWIWRINRNLAIILCGPRFGQIE